jgi:hypothetical protein
MDTFTDTPDLSSFTVGALVRLETTMGMHQDGEAHLQRFNFMVSGRLRKLFFFAIVWLSSITGWLEARYFHSSLNLQIDRPFTLHIVNMSVMSLCDVQPFGEVSAL